ncbi:MAG: sialidase family protein, partial [Candidatus Hydrogenedentes bacterium]|nr:sialidase family protein [Candidatus Hydrogenedentota bacterium]
MELLCAAGIFFCSVAGTEGRVAADFAFFSQSTVAAHDEHMQHGLPCIGRLGDGRLLLVWARNPVNSSDFSIVGALSSDCGCTWTPPKVFIDHPGLLDADPNVVVIDNRVLVTCTTVDFSQGIRTSATWCVRS